MDELTDVTLKELKSVNLPKNVVFELQEQDYVLCGPIQEDVLVAVQLIRYLIDKKSRAVLLVVDTEGATASAVAQSRARVDTEGASASAEAQLPARDKKEQQKSISRSGNGDHSENAAEILHQSHAGESGCKKSSLSDTKSAEIRDAISKEYHSTETEGQEQQQAAAEQRERELLRREYQHQQMEADMIQNPLPNDQSDGEEENASKDKTKENQEGQLARSARLNESNLQVKRKVVNVTAAEWECLEKYYLWEVQKAFRGVAVTVIPPTAVAAAASYGALQDAITLEAADLSGVDIAALETLPRKLDLVTQFHDLSVFYQHTEAVAVLQHILESEYKQVLLAPHPDCYTAGSPHHGYVRLVAQKSTAKSASDRLCVLVSAYSDCQTGSVTTHLANNSQINVYGTIVPGIPLIIMDRSRLIMYMLDKNSGAGQPRDNALANSVISVSILKGDLLTMKIGALVNATDIDLSFGGGISRLIADRAGRAIIEEAKRNCWQQYGTTVPLTKNVVTRGGNLRDIASIIHAVGPSRAKCSSDVDCRDKLAATFFNCLRQADKLQVTSIALPAIGSGKSCDITIDLVLVNYVV
jgi:O-acetyl-ADP-ribose deacetylase (regulator of RNase III)